MIPQADIVAWRRVAPWADDGMVEQDLVLSCALVEIFSDATVAAGLAFRGGTALHKGAAALQPLLGGPRRGAGSAWPDRRPS